MYFTIRYILGTCKKSFREKMGTKSQKMGTKSQKMGTEPQKMGTEPQKMGTRHTLNTMLYYTHQKWIEEDSKV